MQLRRSAFAGSWYPSDPRDCEREIRAFLAEGRQMSSPVGNFVAGIVPHAGWYFSGSIACNVIERLSAQENADVVVLFGMHLGPGDPAVIMARGAWETPFGPLPVAEDLAAELIERFSFQVETPQRFAADNTVELQLPFVKYFNPQASIVAIGAPPVETSLEIGAATVEIATRLGLRMKVIGSTDLTHYGSNYAFAPRGSGTAALDWVRSENDRQVIEAMLAMDVHGVLREGRSHHNACCSGAAATAIAAARQLGAQQGHELAYATSYDKHPGESFVGYVGVLFTKSDGSLKNGSPA